MKKNLPLMVLLIFAFPLIVFAKTPKNHVYFEKDYQKYWCNKHCGKIEVTLPDKARVDCVTDTHAIEFDFAPKWAESIGQSLYYAEALKKSPGIVLIVEDKTRDEKYIKRVQAVSKNQGITLWLIYPEDMK